MKKINLCLEAERYGYSTYQVEETMTVGDLIAFLQSYPDDTPVYISNDKGYTFGGITENHFYEQEIDEDEENEEEDEE